MLHGVLVHHMIPAAIITLRETLEASLVIGIILAYLQKTESSKHGVVVWSGVFAGISVSFVLAVVFQSFVGGFTGRTEELYEGSMMLTAAGLLTWMIIWMLGKRRSIRGDIEQKVQMHVEHGYLAGIFFLAFVATVRESVETVIFLKAAIVHTHAGYEVFGGLLGIAVAISFSYFLFRGIEVLPLRKFFTITSVLLILFAAGLVAHGVHEFQEAGLLPVLQTAVWDINPLIRAEGSYPLLHDKGFIGGMFVSLFGYNGNPTGLELIAYGGYIAAIMVLWRRYSFPKPLAAKTARG